MKITKKLRKDFIHKQLSSERIWARQALLLIYNYQTNEEKITQHTLVENGLGFTAFDCEILTSFAKQIIRKDLTKKQWDILFKKIPKYWGQIYECCDLIKLDKIITTYLRQQEPDQLELQLM